MKVIGNNIEELVIEDSDYMTKIVSHMIIKKAELIDDFIYKNLDTHILQAMKLKIENELMQRNLTNKKPSTD